ncbi:MAG: hypothetical protein ACREFD_08670 [Stellaceae bacterium]
MEEAMRVRGRNLAACVALSALVAIVLNGGAQAGDNLGLVFANGQQLQTKDLADLRGGTSPSTDMSAIAIVDGNKVINTMTGSNTLGGFVNSQGMFTVFQNTGNNVAMQSQTILNVNLQ